MSTVGRVGGNGAGNGSGSDDDNGLNGGGIRISPLKIMLLVLAGLVIVAAVIVGLFLYIKGSLGFGSREKDKTAKTLVAAPDNIGKLDLPILPEPEEAPEAPPPLPEAQHATEPPAIAQTAPNAQPENTGPTLNERRLASGVGSYQQRQKPEEPPPPTRQAKLLRDVDYTLIKGTKIPCVLETNIISEQEGFASCIISQDVYSSNARVLLIEKGTKVTGAYNTGLKNGDRRLGVVWDRLITPYDVVIQLDSPSTGRLGASGISGKVDNRWGTRIGSAILVSLIDDALRIAGDRSKSANVIVGSQTADTGKDMAAKILEKQINLPPIVYIREGEKINIYVADDVDLSSIYNIR